MSENEIKTETATFGAGCFWQVEIAYKETEGVVETAVGYEGGHVDNPTYEQVCTGTTGHAEVTQVAQRMRTQVCDLLRGMVQHWR